MKNFVIFFEEKEGTSPLVRLLDNFEHISIIHQRNGKGWEPFDRHNCGPMPLKNLEACLNMIFGTEPTDFRRLNDIYVRTAKGPLEEVDTSVSVGFKMRFVAPAPVLPQMNAFSTWNRVVEAITKRQYRRIMFDVLKKNNVTVFLAVRQDLLRWGLSKYHGDGSGEPGHLQFKVARGKTFSADLGPIHVDCSRLEEIVAECGQAHERKRSLSNALQSEGIAVHPLRYEDFLDSKEKFLARILGLLELDTIPADIENALARGMPFRKVHSDAISEFVTNHEEVAERIGNPFVSWK